MSLGSFWFNTRLYIIDYYYNTVYYNDVVGDIAWQFYRMKAVDM